MRKSSVEEIRERFDHDVERFSNLETGQTATMDAPLNLELIARAAAGVNGAAESLLDIGCGAGNYSLKLLRVLPVRAVTLVDLSRPMLDRAAERIAAAAPGVAVTAVHGDVREVEFGESRFDIATAAATLHHLRADAEWSAVFRKVWTALKPGGSFWIADLVSHSPAALQAMMWARYGEYLVSLKGPAYRDQVFAYIEKEDTPRPLEWQLQCLRQAGFASVEVLHKNGCFAAFGGVK
jgi:tRNA (cmo5U34)-methyltransferase